MTKFRRMLPVLAVVVLGACATTGESRASGGSSNVLSETDLAAYESLTVYEALQRARPQWLRSSRGVSSMSGCEAANPASPCQTTGAGARRGLRVYVDGVLFGGAADLRSLQVGIVQEIRFLDSRKATLLYGTDHAEGALVIVSKR